jgi:hypothetical protein
MPCVVSSEMVTGLNLHLMAIARANAVLHKHFSLALMCKSCSKQVPHELMHNVRAWIEEEEEAQQAYKTVCPECRVQSDFAFRVQFPSVAQHLVYVDIVDFTGPAQMRQLTRQWHSYNHNNNNEQALASQMLALDIGGTPGCRSLLWNVCAHFVNLETGLAWIRKEALLVIPTDKEALHAKSLPMEVSLLVQIPLLQQQQQQQQQQQPLPATTTIPVFSSSIPATLAMRKTTHAPSHTSITRKWAEIETQGQTALAQMRQAVLGEQDALLYKMVLDDTDSIAAPTDADLINSASMYYDQRVRGFRYQGRRQLLQDAFVTLVPKLDSHVAQCASSTTTATNGQVVDLHRYETVNHLPLALVKQIQYDLATHYGFRVNLVFLAALVVQRYHKSHSHRKRLHMVEEIMPELVQVERTAHPLALSPPLLVSRKRSAVSDSRGGRDDNAKRIA